MSATPPDISVIIVSFNTRDLLRACLASMRDDLGAPWLEVIVVDNASADDSVAMVRAEFLEVQVIAHPRNVGFGPANNIGMAAARGRYFLALNSDTEVKPGALRTLVEFMDAHPDVGVAGARLLNTDGSLQLSCRRFPSFRTVLFHRYSLLTKLFPQNRYSKEYLLSDVDHTRQMDVDWVSGACLLARADAVKQVGGFDEEFFMYAEDVDWCYRMKQGGWRVVFVPEAVVTHHIGSSTRRVPFRMIRERHRSMWLFYRKHYSRGVALLDTGTWLGVWLRCGLMMARSAISGIFGRRARP